MHVFLLGEFDSTGGARTYFTSLLKYLISCGHQITLMVPENESRTYWESFGSSQLSIFPLAVSPRGPQQASFAPFSWMRRNPYSYALEANNLFTRVGAQDTRPNLILMSITSPGRFLPNHKSITIPLVQILHTYPRGFAHQVAGPIFGKRVGESVTVVGVSEYVSRRIKSYWRLNRLKAPVTLPNTAGPSVLSYPGRSQEVPFFLSVGALNTAKAPERFLNVAKRYFQEESNPPAIFCWLGDGPLREKIVRKVAHAGLLGKVLFIGHEVFPERFYKSATVYLQLSKVDSMPLAALEAMRLGVPLIVSRAGGLPELLEGLPKDFVVRGSDSKRIARRLGALISDPSELSKYATQLKDTYEKKYSETSWRLALERLLEAARDPKKIVGKALES